MKEQEGLAEAHEHGIMVGENRLLKQILEQLLKIQLTPKLERIEI